MLNHVWWGEEELLTLKEFYVQITLVPAHFWHVIKHLLQLYVLCMSGVLGIFSSSEEEDTEVTYLYPL
jgi:hypothetical protein